MRGVGVLQTRHALACSGIEEWTRTWSSSDGVKMIPQELGGDTHVSWSHDL